MNEVSDAMRNVLNKCEITVDGNTFSKEILIRAYAEFLSQTMEKRKHNIGVVLHSGSLCFDALIITYAAITNLMFNQTSTRDVLDSLNVGDIVLYGTKKKERYSFEGYVEGESLGKEFKGITYIKLNQDDGGSTYITDGNWRLIEPYNGKSKKRDGRGIRRKGSQREDFFTEVLGVQASDIPSVIDTSTVLVMPKEEADRLIKGISIKFGSNRANLLDLVTASYYTEDEEHSYGGNTGKSEPVLKVCTKISVARKLILSRGGNSHIGLVVMGQEMINRGESELPELINRKSLQYVYICSNVISDYADNLLEENYEVETFACTKAFLTENASIDTVISNNLTEELKEQVEAIREKKNESIILYNSELNNESYWEFKKTLVSIKRNQYESEAKDNFIIQAHSLFNLLLTAPFSVEDLKKCVEKGLVPVESVDTKLSRLEILADDLGVSLRKETYLVIDLLKKITLIMSETTPKEKKLYEYLKKYNEKKIAVVIPKAYYASVLKEKPGFISGFSRRVYFMTPGRFDNSRLYDVVIVLGNYDGKRFNVFNCNSSKEIISLLYEPEEKGFRYKRSSSIHNFKKWDKRSTIQLKNYVDEADDEDFDRELLDNEKEIDEFVSNMDTLLFDSIKLNALSQGNKVNLMAEIVAVATFSDDSKAFFSKHYKAYVLDQENGVVKEVGVSELSEGDSIVFTKNNNDTKDIVDSILRHMIAEGKVGNRYVDSYQKSKEWQQLLIEYMQKNSYSPRKVADKMIALKIPVQEATIIRWLDEDAHTVGPRNIDSLKAVGELTDNIELMNNPEIYFEACREIRSIRRRILNEIGRAIIKKLSGVDTVHDKEFAEVYERVDALAEVLQIERIIPTEKTLPLNVANRPVNI